jgi:hypothetical protein
MDDALMTMALPSSLDEGGEDALTTMAAPPSLNKGGDNNWAMDDPLPTTAATPSLDKGGEIKGPAPNNPPFLMAGPFSLDTLTMNNLLPTMAIPSSLDDLGWVGYAIINLLSWKAEFIQ